MLNMSTEQLSCIYCPNKIQGDAKYHQVYKNGVVIGYRHRACSLRECPQCKEVLYSSQLMICIHCGEELPRNDN